jgi:hypothetical protein
MSIRASIVALAAIATLATSTLSPGNAMAFAQGSRAAAPTRVTTSTPAPSVQWSRGYGWGYGRGWCYWHPYVCYRNR